jgi:hypothetical protein
MQILAVFMRIKAEIGAENARFSGMNGAVAPSMPFA